MGADRLPLVLAPSASHESSISHSPPLARDLAQLVDLARVAEHVDATMPFVRSVIAASTAAGSRFSVSGSTSANTGRPPSKMKQFAVATKAIGDVITSIALLHACDVAQHVQPCRAARDRRRIGRQRSARRAPRTARSRGRARAARSGERRGRAPLRARRRRAGRAEPGLGLHASAGAALPIFAYSSHCAQRSLLPRHVSRYAVWSSFVTGPGGPISRSSTGSASPRPRSGHEDLVGGDEVGADEVLLLDGVLARSCAIWISESRVMPGRIEVESGVEIFRP